MFRIVIQFVHSKIFDQAILSQQDAALLTARSATFAFLVASAFLVTLPADATTVRMQTSLGAIDVVLQDTGAPLTVANFLRYMNNGSYNNSIVHRSVPGFIIQGGGYNWDDVAKNVVAIPPNVPVKNEFSASRSNLRGTIAMAKVGGDPNSATSEWFINLDNNAMNLDAQNGGFTVFGQVSPDGMAVVDAIAGLPTYFINNTFTDLPLISLPTGATFLKSNFAYINKVGRLPLAAVDIDGKGREQVLVRSNSTATVANQLQVGRLVNNAFQFSLQADPGPNFRLVGVGDFDGNGRADLAFQNTTQGEKGDVVFWPDFSPAKQRIVRQVKMAWNVQAVGDLDGDGLADLAWRYVADDPRDTGVSYIWFTNPTSEPQVRKRGGAPLSWKLLGAADINSDGAADMIYISPEGNIRALMATTNRTCANFNVGSVPTGYVVLKLADFTGRGRGDILFRNTQGGIALMSLNANNLPLPVPTANFDDPNANCTSSDQQVLISTLLYANLRADPTWQFYGAGDFNGDGISDVLWLRPDGTLTLWLMNANGAEPTVVNNAGIAPVGFSVVQP